MTRDPDAVEARLAAMSRTDLWDLADSDPDLSDELDEYLGEYAEGYGSVQAMSHALIRMTAVAREAIELLRAARVAAFVTDALAERMSRP